MTTTVASKLAVRRFRNGAARRAAPLPEPGWPTTTPWQEAVALEREVRQAWRQQYASAERVDEEESE